MNPKLYRCGWCGSPTDKQGHEFPDEIRDKAIRIFMNYDTTLRTEMVSGDCCTGRASNEKEIECPNCYGSGEWEAECCNGSGGCSCHGQAVNMGACRVCRGTGRVINGKYNGRANSDFIINSGCCFLGSGPSYGYWSTTPAMGMK